jgi:NAD(P)-dependent dehydrogenase (short-subunit alcohol dehydrogenase family)
MSKNRSWTAENIPDLSGKTAVVTGANSGLGYETTRALARKGAHVVLAVRDPRKGSAASERLREELPGASLNVMELDLASLSLIRAFAESCTTLYPELDLLINNAGVMAIPYRETADGFEMQFGVNHLGHFALTGTLLPQLLNAADARVVTVSSALHRRGKLDFDLANGRETYHKREAYSRSKLANLLFAYELQRKLNACGVDVISVAAHPGYAATNLQFAGPRMDGSRFTKAAMSLSNRFFAQSVAMGALPILYAATAPGVRGGDYIGPGGLMEARGFPQKVESSDASHDREAAAKLWALSEESTGVNYSVC